MEEDKLNTVLSGLTSSIDKLSNNITASMKANIGSITALSEVIGTTLVAAITTLHSDFAKFSSDFSKQSREASLKPLKEDFKPSGLSLQAPGMAKIDLDVASSIAFSERMIEQLKKQIKTLEEESKVLTGIYKEAKNKHIDLVKFRIKEHSENLEGLKKEKAEIAKIETDKKKNLEIEKKSMGVFQRMFYTISEQSKKVNTSVSGIAGRFAQFGASKLGANKDQSFNFGKTTHDTIGKISENVGKSLDFLAVAAKKLFIWFSIAAGTTALFVKAFNPALVDNFLWTLKDLSAVIGEGLQPVLTAFTVVMRATADSLVDVVAKLVPFFQSLGNVIINFLTPIFMGLSNLLQRLAPLIVLIGSVLETLAGQFGILIGQIIENLQPVLASLGSLFILLANITSFLISTLNNVPFLFEALGLALTGFAFALIAEGILAVSQFAISLWTANAVLTTLTGGLNIVIMALVGGLTYLASKLLTTAGDVDKFGLTNKSQSMAARKAEYTSVQDLSSNLIKAAFSGSNLDRLKNIDINGQRQVELLEKIAGQRNKAPQVAMAGGQPGAKA